ncbi:prolyl oligopeptidase family serine peptidase [Streptomyces sp. NA02950]|uniref:alpha/beta hydrolase n=1 Tax=Streptomyces sp. NA02950 TaxID=2742137 RepID=UPI0015909D47|nr:alpha/beta hydrolase-fold protein [Streptomyces sp. NA02950]QKV94149.1 prolyl oligopeptidase family serine peptidase [Streptomyces sp. NA02950]
MGLTSNNIVIISVIAAVLLFAATIWLWPRLAGRGVTAVLGRVGMLLATQFTVFAAFGLFANQSFGFYGSWSDLLGNEDEPGVVVNHDTPGTRVRVTETRHMKVDEGSSPKVAGRIEKVNIQGPVSRIAGPAYIYLPPEYFKPEYAKRRFPAALVLTGYPGTTEALINGLKYPQNAHKLVKSGRMQPTILVMTRPTVAPPRDTECVDVPHGPQAETFFTKDLPKAVSEHYRVGREARNWGVIGNSTGGYCALKMAMRHPDAFSAAVGLSPSYRAPIDATTGDLFGGSTKLERENDLMWRLDHKPAPPVSLLVSSSEHGEKNYKDTMRFVNKVQTLNRRGKPTRISSMILETGGHNFNTWRREVPAALEWLGGRLSDR